MDRKSFDGRESTQKTHEFLGLFVFFVLPKTPCNNADGSAYPAVRPDDFARAEILVPDVPDTKTLKKFEDIVGPMRKFIAQNEGESRTLGELRDTLLPKLMSGEVRP